MTCQKVQVQKSKSKSPSLKVQVKKSKIKSPNVQIQKSKSKIQVQKTKSKIPIGHTKICHQMANQNDLINEQQHSISKGTPKL